MNVTLKKASQLAAALLKAAKPPVGTMSVSRFSTQPMSEIIQAGQKKYREDLQNYLQDVTAAYDIRELIGATNAQEVGALLTRRARLDAQVKSLEEALTSAAGAVDGETLERQRASMAAANVDSLYGEQNITFSVAGDEEFVQSLLRTKLRQRVQVQDQLDALNYTTKIELPEEAVVALRRHDLVP